MNTNNELILRSILCKNPNIWSSEEVQIVCQSFIEACDNERNPPGRLLTTRLWRYWFLVHGEEPLMNDPKYNMALMLNAQAFGDCVPPPGDNDYFESYRQQHQQLEESLTPAPLTWGLRACFNSFSEPKLDSLIVHVFVFGQNNQQIDEVLVVGQGTPEIQKAIFQAAFSCALCTQAGDLDMINANVYRILAPGNNQDSKNRTPARQFSFKRIIPNWIGNLLNREFFTTSDIDSTQIQSNDSEVLINFVRKLRQLQKQTKLVVVHDNCALSTKETLDSELRKHAIEADRDKSCAIIVAKDPEKSPEMAELVTLLPYYHIARRPLPLRITLEPAILDIPSFHELLKGFTYQTVERIRLDAEVRLKTYEKHRASLTEEKKRWDEADERTRKILWDEYVLLTEKFNFQAGITIRLSKPEQCPTAVYMRENVPSLIKKYEQWAERMRKIIEDIQEMKKRPDKPILRLAANRFLDAALRECDNFTGDKAIDICFKHWSEQVTPFLRWRWRTILEAKGIDPEMVFRRNTVFHTRFQIDDDYNVVALDIQPFAMVSPTHSVVVFDAENPIITIQDPSDYAQTFTPNKNSNSDELWQDLQQSLGDVNQKEFIIARLRRALAEEPSNLLTKIIDYLTSSSTVNRNQDNRLLSNKAEIIEQLRLAALPSKIIISLGQGAFHSARQLIKETQVSDKFKVHLMLCKILIECLANKEPPNIFIPNLRKSTLSSTDKWVAEVKQLLLNAEKINPKLVHQWIELLENSPDKEKPIESATNFLQQNWIRFEDIFSTPEQQTLYSAQSAINLIFLARQLEIQAQDINSYSESSATVLAKIDQILEQLLLSEASGVPHSDIFSLLEILLGEEMT